MQDMLTITQIRHQFLRRGAESHALVAGAQMRGYTVRFEGFSAFRAGDLLAIRLSSSFHRVLWRGGDLDGKLTTVESPVSLITLVLLSMIRTHFSQYFELIAKPSYRHRHIQSLKCTDAGDRGGAKTREMEANDAVRFLTPHNHRAIPSRGLPRSIDRRDRQV